MYEMYFSSPTKRWQLKRSNFRKQHFAMKREDVIKCNFRKVNDSNIILEKKWTNSNIVNKMHLKWSCFFIVFFFLVTLNQILFWNFCFGWNLIALLVISSQQNRRDRIWDLYQGWCYDVCKVRNACCFMFEQILVVNNQLK